MLFTDPASASEKAPPAPSSLKIWKEEIAHPPLLRGAFQLKVIEVFVT